MKYKYLIQDESGGFEGTNFIISDSIKEEFEAGIITIVDCEHGEALVKMDVDEWESIPERK